MEARDELHPLYLSLFLIGGACVATGILNLYWSFGYEGGSVSEHISEVGFTALDNVAWPLQNAQFSIPLVVVGLLCLVFANATAWKDTDGY
jgi:hypothetical protein